MTAPTGRKPGRTPKVDTESVVDYSAVKAPAPPKEYNEALKKEWRRIWKIGFWLHRELHYALVKQYCDIIAKIEEAENTLSEYEFIPGETTSRSYKAANGSWASYPEVRLIKEESARMTSLLIEMRLTPGTSPSDNSAIKEQITALTTQNRG